MRWADLYRQVKVKETVFDLLTEQCELARIEEVKSVPTVRVIDPPNWPEKKSFPPRLIIMVVLTTLAVFCAGVFLIAADRWACVSPHDARKLLLNRMWLTIKTDGRKLRRRAYTFRLSSGD